MKTGTAIVLMLVAGVAIGIGIPMDGDDRALLPDDSAQAAEPGTAPDPALAPALAMASAPHATPWAQDIALQRESDGHFYADVLVDGLSTRMLVDTGASVIALTGEDAAALGLYWDESALAPVAQGASGPVLGIAIRLPRVAIGSFEADNVSAIIVPEGLHISLLGQSFLSTVDKVEITGDRMVLGN